MIEGQFQRAGDAFVDAQFAQACLVVALLVAVELAVFELLQQVVDIAGLEFAGGEQDQLDAGLDGGIEEHLVIGIMFGIPEHHRRAFERARAAVEYGESRDFEIVQDFAFECVEIQVHVVPQP